MTTDNKTLADVQPGGRVRLGTPGARWAVIGEPDPHGTRYDCERAALVMGDLTDDELANAVFMHGNERQTMAELIGGATPAIAYLTAAKDRIRWLSRALAAAESLSAQPSPAASVPAGWKLVPIEPTWSMRNDGREFLIDGIEKEPERLAYFLWKTMINAAPEVQ